MASRSLKRVICRPLLPRCRIPPNRSTGESDASPRHSGRLWRNATVVTEHYTVVSLLSLHAERLFRTENLCTCTVRVYIHPYSKYHLLIIQCAQLLSSNDYYTLDPTRHLLNPRRVWFATDYPRRSLPAPLPPHPFSPKSSTYRLPQLSQHVSASAYQKQDAEPSP